MIKVINSTIKLSLIILYILTVSLLFLALYLPLFDHSLNMIETIICFSCIFPLIFMVFLGKYLKETYLNNPI